MLGEGVGTLNPSFRYADGSILFEDSRLQGANRITSMEIDPATLLTIGLGFMVQWCRGLGFRGLGVWVLGLRGLGFRV